MPWLARGLERGVVTSPYPKRPDGYATGFHAAVVVRQEAGEHGGGDEVQRAIKACPTRAIAVQGAGPVLDRGRCILCGRCTDIAPATFCFSGEFQTAAFSRARLVVPEREGDDRETAALRSALEQRVKALRRSVHIRHVDAGSDGSEEWEVAALVNPVYDIQRLGVFFTASPRHADLLLVTGAGSVAMEGPLAATYEAMPAPKVVVAAGTDAITGGMLAGGYATRGGAASLLPVDVFVPGSPPSPFGLLYGVLLATGMLQGPR